MTKNSTYFIVSIIAVVLMAGVIAFNESQRHSRGSETTVSGRLLEWSTVGRTRKPTLRFRLEGQAPDFRVDPAFFRKKMNTSIPQRLRPGADLAIVVSQHEMQSPNRPIFNSEKSIVWVRGLSIDGQAIFRPSDANTWERQDALWGYVLMIVTLSNLGYSYIQWKRYRAAA